MTKAKDAVQSLLQRLPEDCSLEDIQYHLCVSKKVHRSLQRVEKEGTYSQVDVEHRLKEWLKPPVN